MFDGDCASPSTSVRRLWRAGAVRAVAALMTLAVSRTAAGTDDSAAAGAAGCRLE